MKSIRKIYDYLINHAIDIIFLFIMIFYLISFISYVKDNSRYNICFVIPIIIMVYYFIYLMLNKLSDKNKNLVKIVILISSILLYSTWNILCNTQPVSDYKVLIDGAKKVLNGTFSKLSFNKQNYFYFYNFQVGFVLYLSILMKFLGTSLLSLKIVEILVLSFSNLLVYLITSKIYDKKTSIISTMVYSTLIFNIAGSSIINNQHISMLFILLGLYFFVKDNKILSKIFCAIFLSIAVVLRSSSIIFIIAIVCYIIWKSFSSNFEKTLNKIANILIIIITVFCFTKLYDLTLKGINIVPNSAVKGNLDYFKFVLGIQDHGITGTQTTSAEKTQIYYDLKNYNFDYELYNKDTKKYLEMRYKDYTKETIRHINNKMLKFAGYPDNQIDFAKTDNVDESIISASNCFGYAQYVLIIISTFSCSILSLFKSKTKDINNNYNVLFKIIFIGYFICHIFIEVQTRYRFDQYLILSLLAGTTLSLLFDKINKIKNKTKNN